MIGVTNKDSSFFQIDSDDVALTDRDMNRDLISLSITERMGAMPQGSLRLLDKNDIYSRILRTGVRLKIAWGYKNRGVLLTEKPLLSQDEISGNLTRRGLEGFVTSPSGGGGADGVKTYNCNFTAYGFRGEDKTVRFESGTKRDVIFQAFSALGISPLNMVIDFVIANEAVTPQKPVRQDETTYLFLSRLSREWRALFTIGFKENGSPVGIFVDPEKINSKAITLLYGLTGSVHEIGYRGKVNNVKSFKWTSNESENGVGQNVRIELIDGQPVFRRFVAEEETIITYRLNTDKIKNEFKDREIDGFSAKTRLAKELLSAKTFDQVKRFFDEYERTTAPQGFGYKVSADMVGNPLYSPPNQIRFVNGFPDRLGGSKALYYLNQVSHSLDVNGYNMSVEIVDVFAFSDIGQGLL